MLHGTTIILISFAYLGLLFAIAYFADERAAAGRSVVASPYVYSLSLAVYATAWTSMAASAAPRATASVSCRSTSGRR
jgi:hypothetical protein